MFALLEEIHKRFPEQEHLSISYAWGGAVFGESRDGLPFIGPHPNLTRTSKPVPTPPSYTHQAALAASRFNSRRRASQLSTGAPPKANISQVIVGMRGMRE